MDTNQFKQLIFALIGSMGGIGLITLSVFVWLGRILASQIESRTNDQYQRSLEQFRSIMSERQDLNNSLLSVISGQRSKSYDRVLDAVELVWNKVIEIRSYNSNFLFMHSILNSKGMEEMTDLILQRIPNISEQEHAMKMGAVVTEVKKIRPFITEELWELFFVYNAFINRSAWKMIYGRQNRQFHGWDKDVNGEHDHFLMDTLKTIFPEEEIKVLVATSEPVKTIIEVLEVKILEEMNQLILGSKFVKRTIDDYIQFANISSIKLGVNGIVNDVPK